MQLHQLQSQSSHRDICKPHPHKVPAVKIARARLRLKSTYTQSSANLNQLIVSASMETPMVETRSKNNTKVVYTSWQEELQQKIPGSTVVITGGSQGVGRAIACMAAKAGFNVVIVSRNPSTLEEAGKAVKRSNTSAKPPAVLAASVDITNADEVNALACTVSELFEDISAVFNNAGICATGAIEDTPIEATRQLMDVNFTGQVCMTQAFLPALRCSAKRAKMRQGSPGANLPGPCIVMVNSFAARVPLKNMGGYTASKYALIGFTDVLREELRGAGIFVATVNPGVIRSNFLERAQWFGKQGDKARETMGNMMDQAQGIVQTPEEVAAAALECATRQQQTEVNVGPVFNGAIQGYRLTGFNPFALVP